MQNECIYLILIGIHCTNLCIYSNNYSIKYTITNGYIYLSAD